ncbi:hypothetical protein G5576_002299, partial [Homo sapiens]
ETPTDSETTQKARFEMVLDLMQQLQDLGHPPKELAGEMRRVSPCWPGFKRVSNS